MLLPNRARAVAIQAQGEEAALEAVIVVAGSSAGARDKAHRVGCEWGLVVKTAGMNGVEVFVHGVRVQMDACGQPGVWRSHPARPGVAAASEGEDFRRSLLVAVFYGIIGAARHRGTVEGTSSRFHCSRPVMAPPTNAPPTK